MKSVCLAVLGLLLLVPASYFLFALTLRILVGIHRFYDGLAPLFLQSTWAELTLQKEAWILYGPLLAVVFNSATLFRKSASGRGPSLSYRGHWINAAVTIQGAFLSLLIIIYLIIEHIRY